MTKKELMRRVNFRPKEITKREKIEYSSKLNPDDFADKYWDFTGGRIINGRPLGNVLAEKNDAAAMAMCKDAK